MSEALLIVIVSSLIAPLLIGYQKWRLDKFEKKNLEESQRIHSVRLKEVEDAQKFYDNHNMLEKHRLDAMAIVMEQQTAIVDYCKAMASAIKAGKINGELDIAEQYAIKVARKKDIFLNQMALGGYFKK